MAKATKTERELTLSIQKRLEGIKRDTMQMMAINKTAGNAKAYANCYAAHVGACSYHVDLTNLLFDTWPEYAPYVVLPKLPKPKGGGGR